MNTLLLAWRYTRFHLRRSCILVAALAIMIFLPLATRWVTRTFEAKAIARAQQTPLIIGAKGSRFAVALHALYFRGESPTAMRYDEFQRVNDLDIATLIPLHSRFRASGKVIVGTTAEYFKIRQLFVEAGEPMSRLGDCVVGASAAKDLGISPSDKLLSESDNAFDLSGAAPLRMRVTGILQPSGTADDDVVFCELSTAWIMEGIGHGHAFTNDDSGEHKHSASQRNLSQYQEVTDENIKSFHFHGNRSKNPITAIIAMTDSEKSTTLLQGKYIDSSQPYQAIRPVEVIAELMEVVSRVRGLFEIGIISLFVAAVLLMSLVMLLSIRLRERELRTMYLLGCTRMKMLQIVATELGLILLVSTCLSILAAWALSQFAESLMIRLI
ncbi:MAG: FtsX-like permease family protein [Pirellulales bacterium]